MTVPTTCILYLVIYQSFLYLILSSSNSLSVDYTLEILDTADGIGFGMGIRGSPELMSQPTMYKTI
jgi:hypothetical protein